MPTYQYRCAKCGEEFELWQSIHDDALKRHPGCGGDVTKVMAPAGIVLKGSGFYRTDSRSGRKGGSHDKEPAKDGAGSNGSGSESTSTDSTGGKTKESKDTTSKDAKPSKSGGSNSESSSS
jgi:putative FmdB family regulatory protein